MPETATLSSAETIELFQEYVVPNYSRFPVSLVRGEGSYVWDAEGNRYLDFFPGWGCNLLGHCPPRGRRSRAGASRHADPRAQHLVHARQGRWAQAAVRDAASAGRRSSATRAPRPTRPRSSSPGCTRRRSATRSSPSTGGFHGRTLAATAATAQPKYHEGLGPLMAGFVYAPFGDLDAVAKLIDGETAAILIEPMQGEGGINIPPAGFLAGLRRTVRRARICC